MRESETKKERERGREREREKDICVLLLPLQSKPIIGHLILMIFDYLLQVVSNMYIISSIATLQPKPVRTSLRL